MRGIFMKKPSSAEMLFLNEVALSAKNLLKITRGLAVGEFIKLIRNQLKMSQRVLALHAGVPQSTVSRIEQNQIKPALSILFKIFNALSCDLVIAPMLKEPIAVICRRQARSIAERHIRYLKGTMNLEMQAPDNQLLEELIKQEEEELMRGPGTRLWEE